MSKLECTIAKCILLFWYAHSDSFALGVTYNNNQMRNGDYPEGKYVLRAKIDMSSPNLNLRDPVLYRIKHESHQATGDAWCIYPMYDFSHPIADAVEGITHSLCTLEFEDHRPLYDWVAERCLEEKLVEGNPRQIEFSRLNLKSVRMLLWLHSDSTIFAHVLILLPTHNQIHSPIQTKAHQISGRQTCYRLG